MDCNLLAGDIGACTDKTSLGFHAVAKIGNIPEIDTLTYSDSTALITALSMASGKSMYEVYTKGDNPYGEFKISADAKKLGMTFKNDVPIYFKGLTPDSVTKFKTLVNGEFFMGLHQKGVAGTSAEYMFVGLQASLHCTAAEWDAEEGAFKVTLTEDMLDLPVLFLWTGTEGATTKATWDALTE